MNGNAPPPGRATGIRLAATGMATPSRVLTNAELAQRVDTSDEWITQRTGIKERRVVEGTGLTVVDLARQALQQALDRASLRPRDLDMVLVATMTPHMSCPSTAARVVSEIGAVPAGAIDINAACSGFVYGLNMAASLIHARAVRTVAVVGAETLTSIVDWKDRGTCVLFGDAAGCAILVPSDDAGQGCLHQTMHSNGSLWPELYVPRTEADVPKGAVYSGTPNTLQMNGREVYKFAVGTLQQMVDHVLAVNGLKASDLAMIVAHQSNARILESARERLGLTPDHLYINIDRYGNTSAASVPLALHELMDAGRVKSGDLVLFVALGGGMTWASSLWKI